ncbi:MAG: hypothetical protein RSF33_07530, partial [Hydrogenoanaerobacterium sp.]
EEAFGKDIESFMDILWMPEALIIYRFKYKDNLTVAWRDKFNALSTTQLDVAKTIIARNSFTDADIMPCNDPEIQAVLEYYRIRRDAE